MSGLPVLVIEDEPSLRRILRAGLAAQGYRVLESGTGRDGIQLLSQGAAEVALLDLGLPDMDGIEVVRRARSVGLKTPIIILSSRGDERGKITALDLGADDYVTKPFAMGELFARIRAALRRRIQEQGAQTTFTSGDLHVDLTRRLVRVAGAEIKLSNKEWSILRLLVLNAGRVLTHRAIMSEVWGPAADVQYLRIYVRQLRQKLEKDLQRPRHILTETGVGYRLQTPE